ncbi:MAG: DUF1987 domain-containing protein [Microscillaceae bacterium]|nr:DUF1987 domain-containing protein [Microscillaceae bacterium]MDW8460086.1 DUF1987 domain-containing protein [Cytophagales bacterium]
MQGTYFVPEVSLNAEIGLCNIKGESYLEDADTFYEQVIVWIDQYFEHVKKPLVFNFNLSYFNTGSSKAIMRIMKKLKHYISEGYEIKVNWYYPSSDISLATEAEDLRDTTKLTEMNIIAYHIDF